MCEGDVEEDINDDEDDRLEGDGGGGSSSSRWGGGAVLRASCLVDLMPALVERCEGSVTPLEHDLTCEVLHEGEGGKDLCCGGEQRVGVRGGGDAVTVF